VLELEWVVRGFYEFGPGSFCDAVDHLLGMPHVIVERWEALKDALDLRRRGLEFARLVSFDDRRLVRRTSRLGLTLGVLSHAALVGAGGPGRLTSTPRLRCGRGSRGRLRHRHFLLLGGHYGAQALALARR